MTTASAPAVPGAQMFTDTEVIRIADRCDAANRANVEQRPQTCGARAYVMVQMKGGSVLYFCGHCYAKHEDQLREAATLIADERHRLLKRATSDVPGQEARKFTTAPGKGKR